MLKREGLPLGYFDRLVRGFPWKTIQDHPTRDALLVSTGAKSLGIWLLVRQEMCESLFGV